MPLFYPLWTATYRVRGSIWTPNATTTLHHSTEITLPCVQTDRTLANSKPIIVQNYTILRQQLEMNKERTDPHNFDEYGMADRFSKLLARLPAALLGPGFEYQRLFSFLISTFQFLFHILGKRDNNRNIPAPVSKFVQKSRKHCQQYMVHVYEFVCDNTQNQILHLH